MLRPLVLSSCLLFTVAASACAQIPGLTPPPNEVQAQPALVHRTPELRLDQVALSDVIEMFADSTHVNFVVDWKTLEAAGVAKTTPVTLRIRNVATGVALKKVLEAAAPGQLAYYVDQNVVQITTQAVADERMITRIYAVADLIGQTQDFQGPRLGLANSSGGGSRTVGGGGGGSSGGNLFGGGGSRQPDNKLKSEKERAQDLINLIEQTVRPEVWDVNGGKAAIRYTTGRLIVTAPVAVQDAIGGR